MDKAAKAHSQLKSGQIYGRARDEIERLRADRDEVSKELTARVEEHAEELGDARAEIERLRQQAAEREALIAELVEHAESGVMVNYGYTDPMCSDCGTPEALIAKQGHGPDCIIIRAKEVVDAKS